MKNLPYEPFTLDRIAYLRNDPGYLLWLKGAYILHLLREGIKNTVDYMIREFTVRFEKDYYFFCDDPPCSPYVHTCFPCRGCEPFFSLCQIADEVKALHYFNLGDRFCVTTPSGHFLPYNLAKVFMGESATKVDGDKFDCSHLLKFMSRCNDVPVEAATRKTMLDILATRNVIFHSGNFTMTKTQLDDLFTQVVSLLQSELRIYDESRCDQALHSIRETYASTLTTDQEDLTTIINMEIAAFGQAMVEFNTKFDTLVTDHKAALNKKVESELSTPGPVNDFAGVEVCNQQFLKNLKAWVTIDVGEVGKPEQEVEGASPFKSIKDKMKGMNDTATNCQQTMKSLVETMDKVKNKNAELKMDFENLHQTIPNNKLTEAKNLIRTFRKLMEGYTDFKSDLEDIKKITRSYMESHLHMNWLLSQATVDVDVISNSEITTFLQLEESIKAEVEEQFLPVADKEDLEKAVADMEQWFGLRKDDLNVIGGCMLKTPRWAFHEMRTAMTMMESMRDTFTPTASAVSLYCNNLPAQQCGSSFSGRGFLSGASSSIRGDLFRPVTPPCLPPFLRSKPPSTASLACKLQDKEQKEPCSLGCNAKEQDQAEPLVQESQGTVL